MFKVFCICFILFFSVLYIIFRRIMYFYSFAFHSCCLFNNYFVFYFFYFIYSKHSLGDYKCKSKCKIEYEILYLMNFFIHVSFSIIIQTNANKKNTFLFYAFGTRDRENKECVTYLNWKTARNSPWKREILNLLCNIWVLLFRFTGNNVENTLFHCLPSKFFSFIHNIWLLLAL